MQKINARPRNHLLMPAERELRVGTIQPNSFNFPNYCRGNILDYGQKPNAVGSQG